MLSSCDHKQQGTKTIDCGLKMTSLIQPFCIEKLSNIPQK